MDTQKKPTTDNLPYFKFYVDSWLSGCIQGYDMETQGIFINLCARAWKRGGWVEIDERLARLLHISLDDLSNALALLEQDGGPLVRRGKKVSSKFILLQLDELKTLHQKRVEAGRKGGNTKKLNRSSKAKAGLEPGCSILDIDVDIDIDKDRGNKKTRSKGFKKPSVSEVEKYAKSIQFNLKGDDFIDFYESKGWMIGKNKMKDWKAAVRTWKKRSGDSEVNLKSGDVTEDGYIVR